MIVIKKEDQLLSQNCNCKNLLYQILKISKTNTKKLLTLWEVNCWQRVIYDKIIYSDNLNMISSRKQTIMIFFTCFRGLLSLMSIIDDNYTGKHDFCCISLKSWCRLILGHWFKKHSLFFPISSSFPAIIHLFLEYMNLC